MGIPHVMNCYWGTGTRITYLRYLSLASFRAHHPDWSMRLYQSNWSETNSGWNFHEFMSKVKAKKHDYLEEAKSVLGVEVKEYKPSDERILKMPPPNISDIFSYDLLWQEGGWYMDLDCIWVKGLDYVSDKDYNFIGFGGLWDWVGVFGATKGSWVMKSFYQPCVDNFSGDSYNSTGSYGIITNCTQNEEWCQRFATDGRNWRAPADMFYPVHAKHSTCLWEQEEARQWNHSRANTWSVHLYGGNTDYAKFNRQMNGPSYLKDLRNQIWVARYCRTLPANLTLMDREDPQDAAITRVPGADVRPSQDVPAEVPPVVPEPSQPAGTVEVDVRGEQQGPGDPALPVDMPSGQDAPGIQGDATSVGVLEPDVQGQPLEGPGF
jgi:hypothetical protein